MVQLDLNIVAVVVVVNEVVTGGISTVIPLCFDYQILTLHLYCAENT